MNTFLTPEEQIYALQLQLSHFLEKLHETEKMMAQVSLFHQKKCKRLFHQSADTSVDLIYDQTGQLKSLLDQLQQAYQAKYFLQVEGLIRTFGFECLNFTRMQSGLANFYDRFPEFYGTNKKKHMLRRQAEELSAAMKEHMLLTSKSLIDFYQGIAIIE